MLTQRQEQRPLPVQIQANAILGMNTLDLQRFIETESAENPALSVDETARCAVCGFLRANKICPVCGSTERKKDATSYADQHPESQFALLADHYNSYDPFRTVAAGTDLKEYLKYQSSLVLSGRAAQIAEFLIELIDEDGYLREPLFDIAEQFAAAVPEVEAVLSVVQTFDPPGIAARNLRECLLIQVRSLETSHPLAQLTERVLNDHWEDFSRLRIKQIAAKLRIPVDTVKEVQNFVRTNLNPYPASAFRQPFRKLEARETTTAVPDVAVLRISDELVVQTIDWLDQLIGLDKTYERMYQLVKCRQANLDENERKHVKDYVDRARSILEFIELRKRTLGIVAKAVIEHQKDYVLYGPSHMKPLRQKEIAMELGLSESTVSRALANKYCRLPSGELVSFDVFFDSALPIREMISRLISISPRPLSDSEITKYLAEQGVVVARRTVAKYRSQLRLPPYTLRTA
ncbi:MAG: RNA polymerase factor sigma-54 [Armatimonadota bacterium]|nr:RNA polymerase factor sigma-54 [Armatimonadota bacterium]